MTLTNKVVVITGATGGLGAYVTRAFLKAGAKVAGVAHNINEADFSGPLLLPLQGELRRGEGARAVASAVYEKWGRIDALLHLVGGFAGGSSVADTEESVFDEMIDMNLRTLFHMLGAVIPGMRAQGSGRILAIASRSAMEPVASLGVYSASKAALVSLIRTVAIENEDRGIAANVVLPGTMDTPANRTADPAADPAKWVQPDQISALLMHLASDLASNINGAVIPVYGAGA